jgi:periplasmic copper chaperone A
MRRLRFARSLLARSLLARSLLARSLPALPLLVVLPLAAVAPGRAAAAPGAQLSVSGQWIRALTANLPAGGYFTLANNSNRPERLVGAASPGCGSLSLHQSIHKHAMNAMTANDPANPRGGMASMGGMSSMQPVSGIVVPPHGSIRFAPGGYHLMCEQPTDAVRAGQSIAVTLRFEDGNTVTASFPVKGARGG